MKTMPKRIMSYFLQGLLALLPLLISLFLVMTLFGFIERRIKYFLFLIPDDYRNVKLIAIGTEVAAAIVLFLLIVVIGIIIKTLWGRLVVKKIDQTLSSIPGISTIYKASRQVIDLLTMDKGAFLMKPVLVEYPSPGIWAIGFNTGETTPEIRPSIDGRYFTVFIPTTPNPTSGFLTIIREDHMKPLDMPMESVLKLVLTGGMVKSERSGG
jgi:uncharacterized membrane protein